MIDARTNFVGGLNLDDSNLHVPKQSYIDALNITRDAIAGNADTIITNIVGNRIIPFDYPAGTGKYIGFFANTLRNTIIGFRWNANGYHGIYEIDLTNRVINEIFQNLTDSNNVDVLGFTEDGLITSINVFNRSEGDLYFYVDSLGRPSKFDIEKLRGGFYTPVLREYLNVAETWPSQAITAVYGNDSTNISNNLNNRLFKFQYVWCYDDFTETCGSPVSATPLPNNVLDPTYTNQLTHNNVLTLSIPSGGINVAKIKVLMSVSEKSNVWNDFVLVETIDKSKEGIGNDLVFSRSFYNNSIYPLVDLARRIQLFDYIPIYCNCQEMPNGNYLCYGGITEGYDNDLTANVALTVNSIAIGNGGVVGYLSEVHSLHTFAILDILIETFSGVPAAGTVVTIKVNGGTVAATYTTIIGDGTAQVISGLVASASAIGIISSANPTSTTVEFIITHPTSYLSTTITPPFNSTTTNSIATWPYSSSRSIGLAYYDEAGRTNGVVYNSQVTFPAYTENLSTAQPFVPYINAKIYHQPPDWAYSYAWVVTKDPTEYLYAFTTNVNTAESDFIYFDVSNLGITAKSNPTLANVYSWTFQEGDRVRLIKRISPDFYYSISYDAAIVGIITSPIINGVTNTDRTFIKIKKFAPFSTEAFNTNGYVLQIYRPAQGAAGTENTPFFEFGQNYQILNPTLSTRVHGGMITDQSTDLLTPAEFNFYNGDTYIRARTINTAQTPNASYSTFYVQDKNFVDSYISGVNSLDGRANAIDPNAKQIYFPTLIRFSKTYVVDTNINQLNQFHPDNFDEYDRSGGDIRRFKVRDKFMRVYQKLKVGVTFLFSKVGQAPGGNQVTVDTEQLLNPIQYYSGDYGIGDHPECLASFNYADYFVSNITGGIYRVSLDGITPISVKYKVNSWGVEHLPLRTSDSKILGAFDQRLNNYICALEAADYNTNPSCKTYRLSNENLTTKGYVYRDCSGINHSTTLAAGHSITFCALQGSVIGVDLEIEEISSCSPTITDDPYTLVWDEELNTFESFVSYHPENMVTLGTLLVTASGGDVWTHDSSTYNNFYGVQYDSHITFAFNENPLQKKTWISVNEVASAVWDCPTIITNANSYGTTAQSSNLIAADFANLEDQFAANLLRDSNSIGGINNGDVLKGSVVEITFRKQSPSTLQYLGVVEVAFNDSPLNKR